MNIVKSKSELLKYLEVMSEVIFTTDTKMIKRIAITIDANAK